MPSTWLLWDRIRALSRANRIYQADRIFQDQSHLDRITAGGEWLDWSNQAAILDQSVCHINRLQRYKDYEQMDVMGEITLALDLYADECLGGDTVIPLLDGTRPTIAELADRGANAKFWVYSFDVKKNECVPAEAFGARITRTNARIVGVELDDGSIIKCTPDHLFLMSDNNYCQAGDLASGDSLKRYVLKSFANHKVVRVIGLGVVDKVYDITVPKYNCFAAGNVGSAVIVHNCTLVDPERKHTLIIKAKSRRIKRELEELFFGTLMWDNQSRSYLRYLCKFGDCPAEIVPNKNRDGVSALRHMNVYNFTRVETRYGDLVGFFFQDELLPEPTFLHPWQVMHLRLTSLENVFNPYGRAILDGGRKAFRQLRLMEDAALIYRITRAPDKRKFKIPVGMIPPKEVPEYLEMIARKFKRQRFYNPASGTFDEKYSPLIQEDDFFLPVRPDGTGPDVDTLQGAQNLDDIKDIEYFKKKMVAPMKIPFGRVGIGDGAGESSEKSLSATHAEFAKAVQWIQREGSTGLTKVAIVHLALRGYSINDIKSFELAMPASSAIEELYRIETWQTRVQVMSDLKELGWFPKEWIVTHFTDLTPDEIQELKEMEEMAADGGEEGGKDGEGVGGALGGAPPGGALGGLDDAEGLGGEGEGDELGGKEKDKGADEEEASAIPAAGGLGERYNWAAERRLLTEMRRQDNRTGVKRLLERWARRLGKAAKDDPVAVTHFDYLIESKELDGLSNDKPPTQRDAASTPHNPNADGGLLVEWSVEAKDRDSAISETLVTLMGDSSEEEEPSDGDITKADLP